MQVTPTPRKESELELLPKILFRVLFNPVTSVKACFYDLVVRSFKTFFFSYRRR